MLFASISRLEEISQVDHVDGIEFRLSSVDQAPEVLALSKLPVLLTMPGATESELDQLIALNPPYLDIPYGSPAITKPTCSKIVYSYHGDFDPSIYEAMSQYPAFTYKIACPFTSTLDALRLLLFAKAHPNVSAICMGERVQFARVLGPIIGNKIDFACLHAPTAPGQLSIEEFTSIYRYHSLNLQTVIYGLIGDPVDKSMGHLYHNAAFASRNAVYVKMPVRVDELPEFFSLITQLPFRGLCVTMPLKQEVMKYIEEPHPCGAVNTLYFEGDRIRGANTDGVGALDALGSVQGKHIVLLGAGGAAKAIAHEARLREAKVTVLSRTLDKARAISPESFGSLSDVPNHYDILVNCTPAMPIDPSQILSGCTAMDVVYNPRETVFLKAAAGRGCHIIHGEAMFLNQAKGKYDSIDSRCKK